MSEQDLPDGCGRAAGVVQRTTGLGGCLGAHYYGADPSRQSERLTRPATMWHRVIARLNPGISLARAQAAVPLLEKQVEAVYPMSDQTETWGIQLASLQRANTDPSARRSLLVLLGAAGFVLLLMCVNISGLLLARGVSRQGEVVTRMALGATRARVVRPVAGREPGLIRRGGCVWRCCLPARGIDLMAAFRPADSQGFHTQYARLWDFGEIRLGTLVLLFNLVLALACGATFALVPALRTTRRSLAPSLRGVTESAPMGAGSGLRLCQTRSLLVVGQTALAIMLLAGAGLMLRSFVRLMTTKIGFEPAGLLTLQVNTPRGTSDEAWNSAVQQIEQRIGSTSRRQIGLYIRCDSFVGLLRPQSRLTPAAGLGKRAGRGLHRCSQSKPRVPAYIAGSLARRPLVHRAGRQGRQTGGCDQ